MKVIYIAGKYRGPTPWQTEKNIQAAEDVAIRVLQAGMMPMCTHPMTRNMDGVAAEDFMLAGTLELMRRCDAVVLVPNWRDSAGARAEVEEADRLGIPVFGDRHGPRARGPEMHAVPEDRAYVDDAIRHMMAWAQKKAAAS